MVNEVQSTGRNVVKVQSRWSRGESGMIKHTGRVQRSRQRVHAYVQQSRREQAGSPGGKTS